VDAGSNVGPGGLVINWGNDFGSVTIGSDTSVQGTLIANSSGDAIIGISGNNYGVWGGSTTNDGIHGLSDSGTGVFGYSNTGWAVYANGYAGGATGWYNNSDIRYKTHIVTLSDALDRVLALRGVSFDWRRDEFKDRQFTAGRQIGLIAQEVEQVLPELVCTDREGYKSVAYANMAPVLVEAIKALNSKVEAQQKQIEALKVELQTREQQVAELLAASRRKK
jgi:hypothetical protein